MVDLPLFELRCMIAHTLGYVSLSYSVDSGEVLAGLQRGGDQGGNRTHNRPICSRNGITDLKSAPHTSTIAWSFLDGWSSEMLQE